ncbi:MAG TPA: SURF1 family protein [Rhizomicrobium sp.]
MFFRPLPALTVAVAVLLAVLIGLGTWQLQRLSWKLALIGQVNRNTAAAPLTLDRALALGPEAQYRRVTLHGRFDNAREFYLFATGDGAQVFHVIAPFRTGDGRILLVDRGIVPSALRDPDTRKAGLIEGETAVTGLWHLEEMPGAFTPPPDANKRIWYVRNTGGMARLDHMMLAAPVTVDADATPVPGGWPKGGRTVVAFRNEHLQYAITWYLMAVALLGVYLAYHVSTGRLGLTRKD